MHRAHAAPGGAGDERVADLERAAADEDRHHRPAARVELGLDHRAGRGRVGVGLEVLDLGHQDDRLEQIVEPLTRLRRDVDELGVAAPLDRLQSELRHLGAHPVGLRALLVDLVDGDQDRHAGLLGVVDGLLGLWLDAVIGRDHDHRQVRDLGAAGAHRRERLVARGVQERHRVPVVGDLVGADVLGDPAGLAGGHLGLTDRVQQRRLAVVDVAHDRHDRRALDEVLVGVVEDGLGDLLVLGVDDLDLFAELDREQLDRVVGQGLGERAHLAQRHQLLDDLRGRDVQVLGHVLDGRARVDRNRRRVLVQRTRGTRFGLFVIDAATSPAAALAARRLVGARRHRRDRRRGVRPASRSRPGGDRRRCRGCARLGASHGSGGFCSPCVEAAPSAPACASDPGAAEAVSACRRGGRGLPALGGFGLGGGLGGSAVSGGAFGGGTLLGGLLGGGALGGGGARRGRGLLLLGLHRESAAAGLAGGLLGGATRVDGHRSARGGRAIAGRGHGHRRLLGRLDPRGRRRLARRRRPRGRAAGTGIDPDATQRGRRAPGGRRACRAGGGATVAATVGQHSAGQLLVAPRTRPR